MQIAEFKELFSEAVGANGFYLIPQNAKKYGYKYEFKKDTSKKKK